VLIPAKKSDTAKRTHGQDIVRRALDVPAHLGGQRLGLSVEALRLH
jgi:hypothetical protein